jgi:hypothetical protein
MTSLREGLFHGPPHRGLGSTVKRAELVNKMSCTVLSMILLFLISTLGIPDRRWWNIIKIILKK